MAKRKPAVTLEQHAADLIKNAEDLAQHFLLETFNPHNWPGRTHQECQVTTDAVVFGYIVGGLRYDSNFFRSGALYFDPQLVVAEALKKRFAYTDEDFAHFLGG